MSRNLSRDGALSWELEGIEWPNREFSRFIKVGELRWHVQIAGAGPVVLLLHGTGASTHSWRDLLPLLARRFTVIAPDLPGHAFTEGATARHLSLSGMATAIAALLDVLAMRPQLVVGHSAGAAVLAQMCLERTIKPAGLVSFNGALLPIGGLAGQVFSPLAKVFASGPLVPQLFAWWAGDATVVRRLIGQTGSKIEPRGLELYGRLARDPVHTAGALGMMARWDLAELRRRLPQLPVPLELVIGTSDRSVSPDDAYRIRAILPAAKIVALRGLGHLAHEERPAEAEKVIGQFADRWSVA